MTASSVIVTAAVAPLNAKPDASSEQVSQCLAGHYLTVVEDASPWLRVRGDDGYTGWVHRGYVGPASRNGAAGRDAACRTSLGCTIRGAGGRALQLPLGALVPNDAEIVSGEALSVREMATRFPRSAAAIAHTALIYFAGTPYQWGGVTPWGADCSGLVQTCFGLHGIALPRDSSQQATVGREIDGDLSQLREADLLFFSGHEGGAVTHVAVALGAARIVHLALGRGGYAIEELERGNDPYVADLLRRRRFTRRLNLGAAERAMAPIR